MAATKALIGMVPVVLLISACQVPDGSSVLQKPFDLLSSRISKLNAVSPETPELREQKRKSALEIARGGVKSVDLKRGFSKALAQAVHQDPSIIALAREVDSRKAKVARLESQKEFQVSGTLYGGIEDVTDKTAGVAAVLSATRIIFDAGKIDSQLVAEINRVEAAENFLRARMEERANELAAIWIDLGRFEQLKENIDARLLILDPLITQLEQVTRAGIGDLSKVAAAQRTVSDIKVMKLQIEDRLKQTELEFQNAFGDLPANGTFSVMNVEKNWPTTVSKGLIEKAPTLQAQYHLYLAAEADLAGIVAKESSNVLFETRITRPFGGSTTDADESLGVVWKKNFYDGGQLEAEKDDAVARVANALAVIEKTYLDGERLINMAYQTVRSADKSIELASETAEITSEEISYLRKQLVIGGSTLDAVLSAEARLYEAESKSINFKADRMKAKFRIMSGLGLLSRATGMDPAKIGT